MKSISLTLNVNFEFTLKMCAVCYKFAGTNKYFLHTEELQAKKLLNCERNAISSIHFTSINLLQIPFWKCLNINISIM